MDLNPFDLLGVTIDSSPNDVKKAYYNLTLMMHPDKGGSAHDMVILSKAYKWVYEQIQNVNRTISIEDLKSQFQSFCKDQTDAIPLFSDIFNDNVFDNAKFNSLFNNCIIDKNSIEYNNESNDDDSENNGADVDVETFDGYGHLMDASDYNHGMDGNSGNGDPTVNVDNLPIIFSYAELLEKELELLGKELTSSNVFKNDVEIYRPPVAYTNNSLNTFHVLDTSINVKRDFSLIEAPLIMTDYKLAYTPAIIPVYVENNRTFENYLAERTCPII